MQLRLIAIRGEGEQELYELGDGSAVIVDHDRLQAFFPPSIEAALKQGYWVEATTLTEKHLSGQHNQQSHGRGGGSRDKATIEAELAEAKAAVSTRMKEAKKSGSYSGMSQLRRKVRDLESELEAPLLKQDITEDSKTLGSAAPEGSRTTVSTAEWSPTMTREQAEEWSKNSAVKHDIYHVTNGNRVEDITTRGFNPNHPRQGTPVWGDAMYMAMTEGTASMYESMYSSPKRLVMRANIGKMVRVNIGGKDRFGNSDDEVVEMFKGVPGFREAYPSAKADVVASKTRTRTTNAATIETLKRLGYDGIHLVGAGPASGGDQLLVFDPKKLVVVSVETPVVDTDWDPWE